MHRSLVRSLVGWLADSGADRRAKEKEGDVGKEISGRGKAFQLK